MKVTLGVLGKDCFVWARGRGGEEDCYWHMN